MNLNSANPIERRERRRYSAASLERSPAELRPPPVMDSHQINLIEQAEPKPAPRRARRSAPGDGTSLASETEAKASGVRQAVQLVAGALDQAEVESDFAHLFPTLALVGSKT